MRYYITIVPTVGAPRDIIINSDRKLSVTQLWKTVNVHNCKAIYATSDKKRIPIDIRYHYYNTDEYILDLMDI